MKPDPFYKTTVEHLVNQAVIRLNQELEAARVNGMEFKVEQGPDGVVRATIVEKVSHANA